MAKVGALLAHFSDSGRDGEGPKGRRAWEASVVFRRTPRCIPTWTKEVHRGVLVGANPT